LVRRSAQIVVDRWDELDEEHRAQLRAKAASPAAWQLDAFERGGHTPQEVMLYHAWCEDWNDWQAARRHRHGFCGGCGSGGVVVAAPFGCAKGKENPVTDYEDRIYGGFGWVVKDPETGVHGAGALALPAVAQGSAAVDAARAERERVEAELHDQELADQAACLRRGTCMARVLI
jgi:hypothetical protein